MPLQGGAKGKKHRFKVLDRLALLNVGLSAALKNDWAWFKEAWDQHMVSLHGEQWGATFASWVQTVMNDERSNAFSVFVYNETRRVFLDHVAIHVPGV